MNYKYGKFTQEQLHDYKTRIHSLIHWLLIYAENKDENINKYFENVQYKLNGLNELMNHPTQIVEIMSYIESARIEYNSDNYNYKRYRKTILDIHDLIDRIPEVDDE